MKFILLLEDELSDALGIELIINDIPGVEVKHVSTLLEADKECAARQPDAMIADIRLENNVMSLDWLQDKTPSIPTILLTKHYTDAYYQQAKLISANVFLIKPVDSVALKFELERIFNAGSSNSIDQVIVKDGAKFHSFSKESLIWVRAQGNYSTIQTIGKKFVIKISLLRIMNLLQDDRFVQVHRSSLVAVDKIKLLDGGDKLVNE